MAKLGIACSGGGVIAVGVACGVFRALAGWGITPEVSVGTSGGALVVGALASGVPLEGVIAQVRLMGHHPAWWELDAVATEVWEGLQAKAGPLGCATLGPALRDLLRHGRGADSLVSDWPATAAVMTVDIGEGGGLACLQGGSTTAEGWTSLAALQATSAIPPILCGVLKDGHLFIDGGLEDDLPTNQAFSMGADAVLSVNVGGSLPLGPLPAKLNPLSVLRRAADYGTARLTLLSNLQPKGPVVQLRPTIPADASLFGLGQFDALLQAGAQAATAQRAAIEALAEGV